MVRARGTPQHNRRAHAQRDVPASTTVQMRREWVAEQLTRGHRPTVVARMGAEKFGLHWQTIISDISAVRDQWAEESAAERPRAREEMLARIDAATVDATNAGDRAKLLKLRAEVQGLIGPRNVAIAVSSASAEGLSDDEIRERAAAIVRRARERAAGGVGPADGG